MGARLQPVGEKVGHLLAQGDAAGAPLQQGLRPVPAQEQAGALGAVEPLVPRHGDEGRPQGLEVHLQAAGGLGGVHDEGHPPVPAGGGDLFDGQDEAEHIGHMGAHGEVGPPVQRPDEGVQGGLLVEQGRPGHPQLQTGDGVEGPGHRVVLIAGEHDPSPRLCQGPDGDVQAVGGVKGKNHPLRIRDVEQPGGLLPAGKGDPSRLHGGAVAAPAGAGQVVDGPGGGPGHRAGLLEGGGGAVQIDHRATSS